MKIGLISDIHSNLHALGAVLAALDAAHAAFTICAGDLVCYGAYPNEVLATLQNAGISSVTGNYEAAVAWDLPRAGRSSSSTLTEPLKQAALVWTKQCITPQSGRYLRGLPWRLDYYTDGLRIAVLHASLDSLDDVVGPERSQSLSDLGRRVQADILVLGHTHHAYCHTAGGTLFVNPGSVGRSLDGDVRAAYAILDTETKQVEHHRVSYPLDEATAAIERSGMPQGVSLLVRAGARRLEEITT